MLSGSVRSASVLFPEVDPPLVERSVAAGGREVPLLHGGVVEIVEAIEADHLAVHEQSLDEVGSDEADGAGHEVDMADTLAGHHAPPPHHDRPHHRSTTCFNDGFSYFSSASATTRRTSSTVSGVTDIEEMPHSTRKGGTSSG